MIGEEDAILVISLKPRSQKLHQFLFRIRTFYEVDQAGGNDVRQMTDSSGDRIMQPVVKHDR